VAVRMAVLYILAGAQGPGNQGFPSLVRPDDAGSEFQDAAEGGNGGG